MPKSKTHTISKDEALRHADHREFDQAANVDCDVASDTIEIFSSATSLGQRDIVEPAPQLSAAAKTKPVAWSKIKSDGLKPADLLRLVPDLAMGAEDKDAPWNAGTNGYKLSFKKARCLQRKRRWKDKELLTPRVQTLMAAIKTTRPVDEGSAPRQTFQEWAAARSKKRAASETPRTPANSPESVRPEPAEPPGLPGAASSTVDEPAAKRTRTDEGAAPSGQRVEQLYVAPLDEYWIHEGRFVPPGQPFKMSEARKLDPTVLTCAEEAAHKRSQELVNVTWKHIPVPGGTTSQMQRTMSEAFSHASVAQRYSQHTREMSERKEGIFKRADDYARMVRSKFGRVMTMDATLGGTNGHKKEIEFTEARLQKMYNHTVSKQIQALTAKLTASEAIRHSESEYFKAQYTASRRLTTSLQDQVFALERHLATLQRLYEKTAPKGDGR